MFGCRVRSNDLSRHVIFRQDSNKISLYICFWVSYGWILHLVQSGSVSAVNFTHMSCSRCVLIFILVCTGSAMLVLQLYFSFIYTLRWYLFNNMRLKNTKFMPNKNYLSSSVDFSHPSSMIILEWVGKSSGMLVIGYLSQEITFVNNFEWYYASVK